MPTEYHIKRIATTVFPKEANNLVRFIIVPNVKQELVLCGPLMIQTVSRGLLAKKRHPVPVIHHRHQTALFIKAA